VLKLGIIGPPRSGKTTIYNAVAAAHADVDAYQAPTEMRQTVVKVPDPRLDQLFDLMQPPKKVYAEIEYVDFPAMTGDASEIASLPRAVRDLDALLAVLRDFGENPDPSGEARALREELILADLEVIEKRLERLHKEVTSGRTENKTEYETLLRCKEAVDKEQPIRTLEFSAIERKLISGYGFLSGMPLLAVINTADTGSDHDVPEWEKRLDLGPQTATRVIRGKLEEELNDLPPEDREAFMADLGLKTSALNGMITASYALLGLITFFTGESSREVRAWTVPRGAKAPEAAGVIHSDIERGFIRAEVITLDDLLATGSIAAARKAGKARLEGKEYIVQDGDYILFRFNV
jgi:GTP-binding protein YchF